MATITQTRTNLATNPSFETASGSTVNVRTNLAPNPSSEVGITGYNVNAGASGVVAGSRQTTGGMFGSAFYRATWSTGTSTVSGYLEYAGNTSTGITAGNVYTFSAYLRTSFATSAYLSANYWNGSTSTGSATGATVALAANVWTRVTLVGTTAPTGTTGAFLDWFFTSAIPTGATIDMDAVLVEQSSLLLPYFDGGAPLTNPITNPDAATDLSGWVSGGTLTRTFEGGRWWVNVPANTYGYATAPLVVGGYYAGSLRIKGPAGTVVSVVSTDNVYGDFAGSGSVTLPASGEAVVIAPSTHYAHGTNGNFGVYTSGTPLKVTEAYLESVGGAGQSPAYTYYKGTGDFTYAWTGTANASTSVQQAALAAGTDYVGSLAYAYQSNAGFTSGAKAIRITPVNPGNGDSFVEIAPMFSGYTFKPYTTYTISGNRTIVAPQTNLGGTTAFRVNIGTELTPTILTAPTNVAGTVRVVATFTTGAGTTANFIRLYNGSSAGGGDVWWDDVLLTEGAATSTYFDGSSAPASPPGYSPAATYSYSWAGAANASQSLERLSVPLQDYQVQFPDGSIAGAGKSLGLTSITGLRDLAALRSSDVDNAGQDGATPGLSYATKRAVQVKFLIASPGGGAEAAYAPLAANWQNVRDPSAACLSAASYLSQLAAGGSKPVSALQVQLPARTDPLLLLGRPSKLSVPIDHEYQFGWWVVDAEWAIPDGLLYDATPNVVSCVARSTSAGAAFPWHFPVRFPTSTGGNVTAVNGGTYPAKPVYRITGPVTNPRISNPLTGQAIQINLALQSGDVLIVDSASRAVRLNGANRNTALDVSSSFFDVPPGGAALRYSSSDTAPTSSVLTVYTLDTYSTV